MFCPSARIARSTFPFIRSITTPFIPTQTYTEAILMEVLSMLMEFGEYMSFISGETHVQWLWHSVMCLSRRRGDSGGDPAHLFEGSVTMPTKAEEGTGTPPMRLSSGDGGMFSPSIVRFTSASPVGSPASTPTTSTDAVAHEPSYASPAVELSTSVLSVERTTDNPMRVVKSAQGGSGGSDVSVGVGGGAPAMEVADAGSHSESDQKKEIEAMWRGALLKCALVFSVVEGGELGTPPTPPHYRPTPPPYHRPQLRVR